MHTLQQLVILATRTVPRNSLRPSHLDKRGVTHHLVRPLLLCVWVACTATLCAQTSSTDYDSTLAKRLGADARGMKKYVFVLLKTGPTPVPKGPERDEMFKGHFANMNRLAEAGVLVHAGPFDGVDGWRGAFILNVPDIETAKTHVATDPVIINGEMIAEYHVHYGSAALMIVNETHKRLEKPH